MDLPIEHIVKEVARTYGFEFFSQITLALDKVIASSYTFIARVDGQNANTIAVVAHGQLTDNFSNALDDTPCKGVSDNSICIFPKLVTSNFPKDQMLIDMGIEGYLGMPLHDSNDEVIGIVVALYEKEIEDEDKVLALFQLFAGRIAGEFERSDKEEQLLKLNHQLNQTSHKRTIELEQAQRQLVEVEKMAALGDLVAGVAHEVNTPLGVAITAESFLSESYQQFKNKLSSGSLTNSDMDHFVSALDQSIPMINKNLSRSKTIIENFKRMASDQKSVRADEIVLEDYYRQILTTLTPLFKRRKVTLDLQCCANTQIKTFPGYHAQLITNLVTNSVQHGFSDSSSDNLITIIVSKVNDNRYRVDYFDNGVGIPKENYAHVLEPFFTTARIKGNSGLGLPIVFNLVNKNLSGSFKCIETAPGDGVHFRYEFPTL